MNSARILSAKRVAAFVVSICLSVAAGPIGATTSCDTHSRKSLSTAVVATVNNAFITQADVDIAVAASGERDTLVLRRAIKHQLIAKELLRQAAGQGRCTRRKSVAQRATQTEGAVISIQLYVRDAVRPAPVTDADVRARYRLIINSLQALTQDLGNGIRGVAPLWKEMLFEQYDIRAVAVRNGLIPEETSRGDARQIEHSLRGGEAFNRDVSLSTGTAPPEFFVADLPATRTKMQKLVEFDAMTSMQTHGLAALLYSIRQQLETERLNAAIRAVVENLMARANISE